MSIAAVLCLNPDFCLSRGARLHLREALQQEALLWPTQVWGALLCGECSLNLGQCFRLYALCSHTHIYIYFSLSLTGSDPNIFVSPEPTNHCYCPEESVC